jgi:ElaB/YqjD/DUF883 family membrane-anchored ribosome-binding protein
MEGGEEARGDLTDDERARLNEVRAQLDDAASFLDEVLRGWNHGAKQDYQQVEEVAKAVAAARDAAKQAP